MLMSLECLCMNVALLLLLKKGHELKSQWTMVTIRFIHYFYLIYFLMFPTNNIFRTVQ